MEIGKIVENYRKTCINLILSLFHENWKIHSNFYLNSVKIAKVTQIFVLTQWKLENHSNIYVNLIKIGKIAQIIILTQWKFEKSLKFLSELNENWKNCSNFFVTQRKNHSNICHNSMEIGKFV